MASLPEVGLVGPQLLYEDNTIQHAGVVVGMGGWADHVFKNQLPVHRSGPFVSPMLNRNVLAITGACQVIERAKFEQLGGFDEQFIICGSDVDICINRVCRMSTVLMQHCTTWNRKADPRSFPNRIFSCQKSDMLLIVMIRGIPTSMRIST